MATLVKRSAESWTYTLVEDRSLDPSQQTRFTLRPMTIAERAAANDDLVRTVVNRDGTRVVLSRTKQQGVAIAVRHIVDVENFPVGAPQRWPDGATERETFLDQLRDADVQEIANEIWVRSSEGFRASTAGNSSPPELTSGSGGDSPATSASTTVRDATRAPS